MKIEEFNLKRSPGFPQGKISICSSKITPGLNIIYGPNGSGKTTLADCFTAIFYPESIKDWPVVQFSAQLSTKQGVTTLHQEGKLRFTEDGKPFFFSKEDWGRLLYFSLEETTFAHDEEFANYLHQEMMGGYSFQNYRNYLDKLQDSLKPIVIKRRIKELEACQKEEIQRLKSLEQDRLEVVNATKAIYEQEKQIKALRQAIQDKMSSQALSEEMARCLQEKEKIPPVAFSLTSYTKEQYDYLVQEKEEIEALLRRDQKYISLEEINIWKAKALQAGEVKIQYERLQEKLIHEQSMLSSSLGWLGIEEIDLDEFSLEDAKDIKSLFEQKNTLQQKTFWLWPSVAALLLITTAYFALQTKLALLLTIPTGFFLVGKSYFRKKAIQDIEQKLAKYPAATRLHLAEILPLYIQASQRKWEIDALRKCLTQKKEEHLQLQQFFAQKNLPLETSLIMSFCLEKQASLEEKFHLEAKREVIDAKLKAILAPFGPSPDPQDTLSVMQTIPAALALKAKIDELENRLSSYAIARIEDLEKAKEDLQNLEKMRDEALEKRGKFAQNLKITLEQKKLTTIKQALAEERQNFARAKKTFLEVQLGHFLIQRIQKNCEEVSRSIIFQKACQNVTRLTLGRYSLKSPEKEKEKTHFCLIETATRSKKSLSELSHASRIQVIISIRLALLSLIEDPEDPFPLFFDETVATCDEERHTAFLELCQELSLDRQVFYFTSRFEQALQWGANIIPLAPMPQALPQAAKKEKILPEPFDETLLSYAMRIEGQHNILSSTAYGCSVAFILPDICSYQKARYAHIDKVGHFLARSWHEIAVLDLDETKYKQALEKAHFLEYVFSILQKNRSITLDDFQDLDLEASTISKLHQLLQNKEHDPFQISQALQHKDSSLKGIRAQTLEKIIAHLKLQGLWKEEKDASFHDSLSDLIEKNALDFAWSEQLIKILCEK